MMNSHTTNTESLKRFLSDNTDPINAAFSFDDLMIHFSQMAREHREHSDSPYSETVIDDDIFTLQEWRDLMLITAIENGADGEDLKKRVLPALKERYTLDK